MINPTMNVNLKRYADETTYVETFGDNLSSIKDLEKDPLIRDLIITLSQGSGIDCELVRIDLQRFLMHHLESSPGYLEKKASNHLLLPLFFGYMLTRLSIRKNARTGLMLDAWYSGSEDTFFGARMTSALKEKHCCSILQFTKLKGIRPIDLFKSMPLYVKCIAKCGKISRTHNFDLSRYVGMFYVNYLAGLKIRKECASSLIISGNDNGFPLIKAKAAGAKVMLIQNGMRPYLGSSTFAYADHYFSMGAEKINEARKEMGCVFKNVYFFGSLRLHNFLSSEKGASDAGERRILYDIMFVDGFDLPGIDEAFEKIYSIENEKKLIGMLNDMASTGEFRIAFQLRGDKTVDDLKNFGLFSEHINYISGREQSIYTTLLSSEVVLTGLSTVGLEAMALNKRVCYANLSGNARIAYEYRDLNIEYREGPGSLSDYIKELMKQDKDYRKYIIQNPRYVDDLLSIVDRELKEDSHAKHAE